MACLWTRFGNSASSKLDWCRTLIHLWIKHCQEKCYPMLLLQSILCKILSSPPSNDHSTGDIVAFWMALSWGLSSKRHALLIWKQSAPGWLQWATASLRVWFHFFLHHFDVLWTNCAFSMMFFEWSHCPFSWKFLSFSQPICSSEHSLSFDSMCCTKCSNSSCKALSIHKIKLWPE